MWATNPMPEGWGEDQPDHWLSVLIIGSLTNDDEANYY